MKVKDLMAELLEKMPDDEVMIQLTANVYAEGSDRAKEFKQEFPVTSVLAGNSPVLLECEANINVTNKIEVW